MKIKNKISRIISEKSADYLIEKLSCVVTAHEECRRYAEDYCRTQVRTQVGAQAKAQAREQAREQAAVQVGYKHEPITHEIYE